MLKAKNRIIEEKLFNQWCHYAQLEESFNDFKKKAQPKKERTAKDIIKEVDGYIALFNANGIQKTEL